MATVAQYPANREQRNNVLAIPSVSLNVGQCIGGGGSSSVFLAESPIGRVAVKSFRIDKAHMITNEVRCMQRLRHCNIIKLLFSEGESEIRLILEFFGSSDLFDALQRVKSYNARDTKLIFSQVLSAVEYCHRRGVFHRDIKCENILIDEKLQIKLCDFGLATTDVFSSALGVGTRTFMAPELLDLTTVKYRCSAVDVWALGVLYFRIRYGILPWTQCIRENLQFKEFVQNQNIFFERWKFSESFASLFAKALDINATKRISSQQFRVSFSLLN